MRFPARAAAMTCRHFRPQFEVAHRVGSVGTSHVADACLLLAPWKNNHRQVRRALHERGFLLSPTPFDCPVAAAAQWRRCPFFEESRTPGA